MRQLLTKHVLGTAGPSLWVTSFAIPLGLLSRVLVQRVHDVEEPVHNPVGAAAHSTGQL
jgi:hypothetical protein